MIRRLVKLTFREASIDAFREIFDHHHADIRSQAGCEHLELWQDMDDPRIFFTYSHWQDAADLERYRHSDLFGQVWKATKALFDGPPEAWSTEIRVGNSAM